MQSRPKAYSYIRISSKGQIDGDGLDRQLRKAREYAAKNDLDLDTELQDVGSGYHGKHVKFGTLGGFLRLAQQRKIPEGSWLLVESLDRLSREDVLTAQAQFIELLQAGVTIATLVDNQVYHRDGNDMQLIMSLAYMMRANDESETKSVRAKEKIRSRKLAALSGKRAYNPSLGHWIDQHRIGTSDEYTFTLNEHAKTIQRIFEMADSGVGNHSIARVLNQTNTPVLRPSINQKAHWRDAAVAALLRDQTTVGTYTVYETIDGQRVLLGDPIKNYYPAAVSEELFWRVQRKKPKQSAKGNVGRNYANLFPRNTTCAHCGGRLKMILNKQQKSPRRYYTCSQRVLTGGIACDTEPKAFRYDELEAAVLEYVTDFHSAASEVMQKQTFDVDRLSKTMEAATEALNDYEKRISILREELEVEDNKEERGYLRERVRKLRDKREQQQSYVAELKTQLSEADEQRSQLASVTERINMERLSWQTGTEEEVIKSRARVARYLAEFITDIEVDFIQQIATVYVAGYTSAYRFDRDGKLLGYVNLLKHFQQQGAVHKIHRTPTGRVAKIEQIVPTPLTEQHLADLMRGMGWNETKIEIALKANRLLLSSAVAS